MRLVLTVRLQPLVAFPLSTVHCGAFNMLYSRYEGTVLSSASAGNQRHTHYLFVRLGRHIRRYKAGTTGSTRGSGPRTLRIHAEVTGGLV